MSYGSITYNVFGVSAESLSDPNLLTPVARIGKNVNDVIVFYLKERLISVTNP